MKFADRRAEGFEAFIDSFFERPLFAHRNNRTNLPVPRRILRCNNVKARVHRSRALVVLLSREVNHAHPFDTEPHHADRDRQINAMQSKFCLPESDGLVRRRLVTRLGQDTQPSIHVIVAPAGAGKTTLMSQLAAAATAPIAWCQITEDDRNEAMFASNLCQALQSVGVDTMSGSIDGLLERLDACSSGGVLFLDDAHEVLGSAAEHALRRFIAFRPSRLHVVCGSRRQPPIDIARTGVFGTVREIGVDDLRFRSWEVEELFAKVYGEPLRPEAAAALTRRVGGWAAGFQLFHLATSGRSAAERHRAVGQLGGHSRLVRAYLARNVLADLSESRRQFLVRTASLGTLTGPLCDALLGAAGSRTILEELADRHLFTVADLEGVVFRYHEVLRSHLELALVEELGEAEARAWYRRGAKLLESAGYLRDATRAFAKAADWQAVCRLTHCSASDGVSALDETPPRSIDATADPWLALASARRLVYEGALAPAVTAYSRACSLLADPEYLQRCEAERKVAAAWMPEHGSTADGTRQQRHWSEPLRRAMRGIPASLFGADPWSGAVHERLVNGVTAIVAGNLGWAREALAAVVFDDVAPPMPSIAAELCLAILDSFCDEFPQCSDRLCTLAVRAENENFPWLANIANSMQELLLINTKATWRIAVCRDMVRDRERIGDLWGAALLSFGLGVVHRAHAEPEALEILDDARKRFRLLNAPVMELWCQVLSLRTEMSCAAAYADEAVTRSVQLRVGGAKAIALWALGKASNSESHLDESRELAVACQLPTRGLGYQPGRARTSTYAIPKVAVVCFGGFRIEVDGQPLDIGILRPQARTLLRLLCVSPDHDHHRESLEDALWPGVLHATASHRLQVAVSSIRSLLAGTGIRLERDGEAYRLSLPSGSDADIRDFETALNDAATGDIERRVRARTHALELYRGDLLPEDGPADHVASERERLRTSAAAAANALAADCSRIGDTDLSEMAAKRSLQLNPYQDEPRQLLAELYEKRGDLSAALEVRREHTRIRGELGISDVTSRDFRIPVPPRRGVARARA